MLDLESLKVKLPDYGGDWHSYINALYEYFSEDLIIDPPSYLNCEVSIREIKKVDGKEETFWHVTSDKGKSHQNRPGTQERTPDLKRSERIRWIKEIIENSNDISVKKWIEVKEGQNRHHLWYKDEYIVVLGEYRYEPQFRLITAFYTSGGKVKWFQDRFEMFNSR